MYIPKYFHEQDQTKTHQFIEDNNFGTIISDDDGTPFASHLPFLLNGNKLYGHLARSNPHFNLLAKGQNVLVIFQGPNCYISPSWYLTPGVPTWNYIAIHISGKPKIIEKESMLFDIINKLTKKHEDSVNSNWKLDVPQEKMSQLLAKIVGFEIEINTIESKSKLSQNRSKEDQLSIIKNLGGDSKVAKLMKTTTQNEF